MANGKLQSMELTATLKLKLIAEISIGVRLKNEKNWVSKIDPYTNSLSLNPFLLEYPTLMRGKMLYNNKRAEISALHDY